MSYNNIYILPIAEAALMPETYCLRHFPERMKRAEKYRFVNDRLRCIGAGALMHGILGIDESDIGFNSYGKPYIKTGIDLNIKGIAGGDAAVSAGDVDIKQFSLSHSGDFTVLAVSDGSVGVDVEFIEKKHTDIAGRVLKKDELEWMKECGQSEEIKRFFVLWTLKESIMKAEGKGLAMDPCSFSVLPLIHDNASNALNSIEVNGNTYYGESFEYEGHIFSMCSLSMMPAARSIITSEFLLQHQHDAGGAHPHYI